MTEAEWLACENPRPMFVAFSGRQSRRKVLLFAVAACSICRARFTDRRCWSVVEAAERFADGSAAADDVASVSAVAAEARMAAYSGATLSPGRRRTEQYAARAACSLIGAVGTTESRASFTSALDAIEYARQGTKGSRAAQARLWRDIFGNPFRPAPFAPEWRTDTAVALASQMYESRDFGAMPILADALQDAGCNNDDLLDHCRAPHATHVRGCWAVDLVLGKM